MGELDGWVKWSWIPAATVVSVTTMPYVALIGANAGQALDLVPVAYWWAISVAAGLMVVRRSWRAATFAAPPIWLFFQYPAFEALPSPLLMWIGVAAAVAAVMVIGSRVRLVQQWVAAAALLLLVVAVIQTVAAIPAASAVTGSSETRLSGPNHAPDVWVFIPDGYSSVSRVESQTGLELSGFVDDLESRGFVMPDAEANYPMTYLSVASILEMGYVAVAGDDVTDRAPFYQMLAGDNATVDQFTEWGYEYVAAPVGFWSGATCPTTGFCVAPGVVSSTSRVIAAMTPLYEVVVDADLVHMAADHADPVFIVDQVLKHRSTQPVFVVAHLLEPHPPSLRTADCDVRRGVDPFGNPPWDAAYAESLECFNRRLTEAVDMIGSEAVVVVHSDHGSNQSNGDARFDVFSAVRGCDMPAFVSSVNLMRLISGCVSEEPVDLLAHRKYQGSYENPILSEG